MSVAPVAAAFSGPAPAATTCSRARAADLLKVADIGGFGGPEHANQIVRLREQEGALVIALDAAVQGLQLRRRPSPPPAT